MTELGLAGYVKLRPLGRPATGTGVLARPEISGDLGAVKFLAADLAADPDFLARFSAEAVILERLRHPNIVPVHQVAEGPDGPVLVMGVVGGVPLHPLL